MNQQLNKSGIHPDFGHVFYISLQILLTKLRRKFQLDVVVQVWSANAVLKCLLYVLYSATF